MKRTRSYSPNNRARKVACTVSAAALMLGVSQAATVGFNFQCDWDDAGSPSYTGKQVTATAFGISPQGWQNLTPLPTGYNGSDSGPFVGFNEVIDTTTSDGGLNPLPQGSITVNWAATAGNCSGFAGYGVPYGAPNPHPGSQQVYYGFLRDEVNIYTSPTNPPGPTPYHVTITGLRSVWTNYAVQLIAATDSGAAGITNAFISGTGGTEPLTYNVPLGFKVIGGLSTASGLRTDDLLSIYGAPATNTGAANDQGRVASTIAGFIITDKPVISMSPQQVLVCGGDTVVWAGYAAGVPPLSYQWRKNGVPIAGATTSAFGITNVAMGNIGSYDLRVTNLYGTAFSSAVTIGDEILTSRINNLVLDSNPKGAQENGQNHGATWLASSKDGANVTRTGVMSFSASATNQITVAGKTNFNSSAGTIMFWMRSGGLADPLGNPAALLDRANNNNGCVIVQNADGTVTLELGSAGAVSTTSSLSDNLWHQVAVAYDQPGGQLIIYADGNFINNVAGLASWSWPTGQELEWGLSHNTTSWQAYNGLMDDVRFYNRVLTGDEITAAFTGALVDTNALVMQLNFTTAPTQGVTLQWQSADGVLQSATSVKGPYTDVVGAGSPYSVPVQNSQTFYRYRHTPVVIIANPYLM